MEKNLEMQNIEMPEYFEDINLVPEIYCVEIQKIEDLLGIKETQKTIMRNFLLKINKYDIL